MQVGSCAYVTGCVLQVAAQLGAIDVVVYVALCLAARCAHTCTFPPFLMYPPPHPSRHPFCSYNACMISHNNYDALPLQSIIDAAMVNQASLWAAYFAVSHNVTPPLPHDFVHSSLVCRMQHTCELLCNALCMCCPPSKPPAKAHSSPLVEAWQPTEPGLAVSVSHAPQHACCAR